MSNHNQNLSARDRELLSSAFLRMRGESAGEVQAAYNHVQKILKEYGRSLDDVADHPEWLLGQTSATDNAQLIDAYNNFVAHNINLAKQNRALINENSRLTKKFDKTLDEWDAFFGIHKFAKEDLKLSQETVKLLKPLLNENANLNIKIMNIAKKQGLENAKLQAELSSKSETVDKLQTLSSRLQSRQETFERRNSVLESSLEQSKSRLNNVNAQLSKFLSFQSRIASNQDETELKALFMEAFNLNGHDTIRPGSVEYNNLVKTFKDARVQNKPIVLETALFSIMSDYPLKKTWKKRDPKKSRFSHQKFDSKNPLVQIEDFLRQKGRTFFNAVDKDGRSEFMAYADLWSRDQFLTSAKDEYNGSSYYELSNMINSVTRMFLSVMRPNPLILDKNNRTEVMALFAARIHYTDHENEQEYKYIPLALLDEYFKKGGKPSPQVDVDGKTELVYLLEGRSGDGSTEAMKLYHKHGGTFGNYTGDEHPEELLQILTAESQPKNVNRIITDYVELGGHLPFRDAPNEPSFLMDVLEYCTEYGSVNYLLETYFELGGRASPDARMADGRTEAAVIIQKSDNSSALEFYINTMKGELNPHHKKGEDVNEMKLADTSRLVVYQELLMKQLGLTEVAVIDATKELSM